MKYVLTLEESEVNLVANALAQVPFGQVAGLMGNLKGQIESQQAQEAAASVVVTSCIEKE